MRKKSRLFGELKDTIANLDISSINEDRKLVLRSLVHYIQNNVDVKRAVELNFICTHNSRRSHLSQVWAQTMAAHFGIRKVFCYSGGIEVTTLFPMVAETLKNSGFQVITISKGENQVYSVKFSEKAHSIICFSKTFDHDFNPKSKFAAVMVCSDAEEKCPFISNAEKRLSITYEDPKAFDNTPEQAEKYQERSLQIATEMYYVFSRIK